MGWLLAVCCVAQFMVILDLSIVNVALPSIQLSLGFSAPELQWIVDAYAITFAGFLMLGGRAADHFGQRRTFVLALLLFGLASLAGGLAPDRTLLVAARAAQGLGGALMAASSLAIITSSFKPGPQAQPRDRRVGRDERPRRRRRDAVRRDHHPGAQLALGTADQPPDRDRRRAGRLGGRRRAPPRAQQELRRRRRRDADDRSDGARVWGRRSGPRRLGHAGRARPDHRRHCPARRVRSDRDAPRLRTADPLQGAHQAAADRQQHRAAVQRLAVPDVVRELALPAAGAGALAAAHRPDLSADDADDHARRLAHRQTREPLRGAPRARRRPGPVDRRHAAARQSRLQRQPDRVHHDPRPAHRGGDRDVDRALHDRRHAGRQGGAGGARLRPRQHLAPGRRRARARDPGHARDPALEPPDRHRPAGAAGLDRRLPARLSDRRRPRGGGGPVTFTSLPKPSGAGARSAAPGGRDRRRPRGLPRRRHRACRLARRSDRRVHPRRRLQLRHRALATPAQARRQPSGARQPARARLHLHHELLRPERTPAHRPERADDPRRHAAARLVPARAQAASPPPT